MTDLPTLHLKLNPQGVAAATQRVIVLVTQAVGTSLRALGNDSCDEPLAWGDSFGFQFNGLKLSPEDRRTEFRAWVLAKGFQDLARGVREGLEEAYFFVRLTAEPSNQLTTGAKVEALLRRLRKEASTKNFPQLLEAVNAGLTSPVVFEAEFQSIQKVRNCLEHRGGVVAEKDVDAATNTLALTFPRIKIFYQNGDSEVEIGPGVVIDTHSDDNPFGKEEVEILMRRVTRLKEYALGERVVIEPRDFFEIALACHLFASDVAAKLPQAQG